MEFIEKEMREDLHKVRIRKYLYLGGGLLILALGVALFVLFVVKKDWPALLLAAIGVFWCIMLFYHFMKTRELEALISQRSQEVGGERASGAVGGEELEVGPETAGSQPEGREPEGGRSR
jgi:hypothetical protein